MTDYVRAAAERLVAFAAAQGADRNARWRMEPDQLGDLATDGATVAAAWLNEHPGDEDERIRSEWFTKAGWTYADHYWCHPSGQIKCFEWHPGIGVWGALVLDYMPANQSQWPEDISHVRELYRLMIALGIPLKEQA